MLLLFLLNNINILKILFTIPKGAHVRFVSGAKLEFVVNNFCTDYRDLEVHFFGG